MIATKPTPVTSLLPDYQRVLITGVGGPSGRAATAALKARGCFVLGADMQSVSYEGDQFVQVPSALDPSYPDVLRSLIGEYRIGWLFPTVAEELGVVARLADELHAQGVVVFISHPSAVDICQDKWTTAQALDAHGIAVPRSAVGSADDPAVRSLGFPVISRPRFGRGGRGVVVHDAPGVAPAVTEPIWQEFMSGTEYDVLCVRHPAPPHHMVLCQVLEKTLLKEGRVGNALEVKAVDEPDIAALAESVTRALSLTGPIDMDIRRGQDGVPRLLEINARIGAQARKFPEIFDVLVALAQEGNRG